MAIKNFGSFRVSASDGSNLWARIEIVLQQFTFTPETQLERLQLQKLSQQIQAVITEIQAFSQQQIAAWQAHGAFDPSDEVVLQICQSKLEKTSAVAQAVIPVVQSLKAKGTGSLQVVDEYLDIEFLEALADVSYSQFILRLMQAN